MTPRWLKIKAAISYSSIGRDRLKRLALEGEIRGFKDTDRGDWVFDRKSIDKYCDGQVEELHLKMVALGRDS